MIPRGWWGCWEIDNGKVNEDIEGTWKDSQCDEVDAKNRTFFFKNQQLSNKEDNGIVEKDSKGARKDNVGFRVGNNMSKYNNNNNIFSNI